MVDLWESADSINKDVLGLTMLLSGLFICFFGAKFFKHIIFFIGFIIGGMGAYFLIPDFILLFGFTISEEMLLYVSLAFGAAFGILFVVIYKVAVFCCGGIAGIIVVQAIWQSIIIPLNIDDDLPYPDVIQVVAWIIFFLIGGWLAFKLAEFLLKGITAFIGAFLFASSVAYFIARFTTNGNNDENTKDIISWISFFSTTSTYKNVNQTCDAYCYICVSLWILLFVAGCYIQYRFHKRHNRKEYEDNLDEIEDSFDEVDEKAAKRKEKRKAAKARKGGTVKEPIRNQSGDLNEGGYAAAAVHVGQNGGGYQGRASYYTQNTGYNGYSPNYGNYSTGPPSTSAHSAHYGGGYGGPSSHHGGGGPPSYYSHSPAPVNYV